MLVRGINVGGNRKLPMTDLRTIAAKAGGTEVATYIQSGNVVLGHPARSAVALRDDLERRLHAATGWDLAVVVRTADELAAVVADNPFPESDPAALHVAFLRDPPPVGWFNGFDVEAHAPESVAVVGDHAYLHLPDGMGRATLPVALGRLRPPDGGPVPVTTTRNWRTVAKLVTLSGGA